MLFSAEHGGSRALIYDGVLQPKRVGFGGDFPHVEQRIHGSIAGRTSDEQNTCYHNLGHQDLQFACVGGLV